MKHATSDQPLTSEEQRQLRALLYRLSLPEMLKVVMEVNGRQRENESQGKPTAKRKRK